MRCVWQNEISMTRCLYIYIYLYTYMYAYTHAYIFSFRTFFQAFETRPRLRTDG